MLNKIVIAGGNGFLGQSLARHFADRAKEIVIISRRPVPETVNVKWRHWDGIHVRAWAATLENADAVINLAGRSVDCRYTAKNKREIYASRIDSTNAIGNAIRACHVPPKAWINASSATIYNGSYEKLQTEAHGDIGNDFSMDVCKQWEATFDSFNGMGTRKILMRISIVLGKDGGALPTLGKLVRFGLGGRHGNGRQFCSWIHVEDFCRAVEWLISNPSATGAYNVTAPIPVRNHEFMGSLRKSLRVKVGIPTPKWLLEIGAFIIRTQPELVLKSRKVYPERLLQDRFQFQYPGLEKALHNLLK